MLKNILKTALRNIYKEKTYSLINILGLTVGITCSIFLFIYVLDELSFEHFHKNRDRIFRVVTHFKEKDNEFTWTSAQIVLAPELERKYSEVIHAIRFMGLGRQLFENTPADIRSYEEEIYATDSAVFDVFTYPLTEGDPTKALVDPNTMVITASMAKKYFGNEDPLGKTLKNGDRIFTITGLMDDVPHNSDIQFDALVSARSLPENNNGWGGWGVLTFLYFPEGYDYHDFSPRFEEINTERIKPIFEQYGVTINYFLQPLTDMHLHSDFDNESQMSYIYIFLSVAVFMLLIASINYMNLATARASRRAKEVGIRKAAGSSKKLLVGQFLTESLVITFIGVLLSVLLVVLLLPFFNDLAGTEISYPFLLQPVILAGLAGIILIIGVAGGSYPAFYLARFNPAIVLKNAASGTGGNRLLRRILVVIQFTVSITMVISTWVVYDQLQYIQNKDLGFQKDHILSAEMPEMEIRKNYDVLRNKLLQTPGVEMVASASTKPGNGISKNLLRVETDEGTVERGIDLFQADYYFQPTLGMEILKGRNFSPDFISDSSALLVNEAMVARMGWKDPIGIKFSPVGDGPQPEFRVIGVIKDYNQLSLYNEIDPLAIFFGKNNYYLHIKISGNDASKTVAAIQNVWKEVNSGKPFNYVFLDDDFNSRYKADEKRGQIFTLFSILTVVISLLGLLGLAAYTTEQRTKEIGIRKVIGATIPNILMLVSKEYVRMIAIGFVLAVPITYYFIHQWLKSFAFQVSLGWWMFALPGFFVLAIALIAVSGQSLKAAMINPTKSLRSE